MSHLLVYQSRGMYITLNLMCDAGSRAWGLSSSFSHRCQLRTSATWR